MKITQAFTFEAAHCLPKAPENHRCHQMHGHSYHVELRLEGPVDPDTGFVVDFVHVEATFRPLLQRLDHQCLNQINGLENPTAESVAIWIWDQTKPLLPELTSVKVAETPTCWAEYEGQS
ncbi:6-carboxytetrahydropterin synthase QueD [Mesorhizobium hawassense]|uniref:6-carboxy-5,6,7,8-tetrahydropterin synthase n=1 Tax=Mesorhizobium hawassense TaxID=1209954 RepID=A0A330HBM9_9HYPH|nr:6-carboxytetrahydropterin synthase QueD [Mesorhizobium hawassense]RAZ82187.1 6-carboxytetrahydropterin synthase QueD [Mesorhizobium hawassense]